MRKVEKSRHVKQLPDGLWAETVTTITNRRPPDAAHAATTGIGEDYSQPASRVDQAFVLVIVALCFLLAGILIRGVVDAAVAWFVP